MEFIRSNRILTAMLAYLPFIIVSIPAKFDLAWGIRILGFIIVMTAANFWEPIYELSMKAVILLLKICAVLLWFALVLLVVMGALLLWSCVMAILFSFGITKGQVPLKAAPARLGMVLQRQWQETRGRLASVWNQS